jgi:hypothetical protein
VHLQAENRRRPRIDGGGLSGEPESVEDLDVLWFYILKSSKRQESSPEQNLECAG